jgi:CheY-like chemotaxis protein
MPERTDRRRTVILIVDEEVVARNLAANTLHRDGYTVLAAAHGREALDLLRTYSGRIDLVIADLDIPKMDGLELCDAVVKERPGIKTCAMSANAADRERASGRGLPFLIKPLDPELLRAQFPDLPA